MKKCLLLFFIISLLLSGGVYAEETQIDLQYILKGEDNGFYNFYLKNQGTDPSILKLYLDSVYLENANKRLDKDFLELKDFYRNYGEFYIEKMKTESLSGITKTVSDSTSNKIKIRKLNDIYFVGNYNTETRSSKEVYILPLNKNISSYTKTSSLLENEFKLNINGTDYVLEKDSGEYVDGKYYISNNSVIFITKNLKDKVNKIILKIDGLNSNYIVLNKQKYIFSGIDKMEVDNSFGTNIRIYLTKPIYLNSLNDKEIYINSKLIDKNDVTLTFNNLIIKYDLINLKADENIVTIYLKDTLTNDYSNINRVNLEEYSKFYISKIDVGDGKAQNFNFKIKGNISAYYGDLSKIKVNINGIEYTSDGIKEFIKDNSGVIQKDFYGNDMYNIINKISLRRTGNGLEFDFFNNKLKDKDNVLYIKNDNSGRESNKVLFSKSDNVNINYDYSSGSTINMNPENIKFEQYPIIDNKKIDFLYKPEKDFKIGKINFNNLVSDKVYNIKFKIKTNLKQNPFYELKLDTINLELIKESDGTFSFIYEDTLLGKDFKQINDLILNLNELFNINEKDIQLNIVDATISKLNITNKLEVLFSNKDFYKIYFKYFYNIGGCFDGEKDYCGVMSKEDPSLLISLNYIAGSNFDSNDAISNSGAVSNTGIQNTEVISQNKKNVQVIKYVFKNVKFTALNNKLIKIYNKIKSKKNKDLKKLNNIKVSMNIIINILKDFEDNKISSSNAVKKLKKQLKILNPLLK
ncbi:hypothetical protein KAZ01_02225 [Candidatus Gracilibacteria bacterium]|nr:hypothetical protein [Candidatus Gracilibacteria bacterium]